MELVVVVAEQVSEKTSSSLTLVDLVARLRMKLDIEGSDHDGVELRLRQLGVDLDDRFYAEATFVVRAPAGTRSANSSLPSVPVNFLLKSRTSSTHWHARHSNHSSQPMPCMPSQEPFQS